MRRKADGLITMLVSPIYIYIYIYIYKDQLHTKRGLSSRFGPTEVGW
jgi:hypothetical protein